MKSILFLLLAIGLGRAQAQSTAEIIQDQCYMLPDGRLVRTADGDTVEGLAFQPLYTYPGNNEGVEDNVGSPMQIFVESIGWTVVYSCYTTYRKVTTTSTQVTKHSDGALTTSRITVTRENQTLFGLSITPAGGSLGWLSGEKGILTINSKEIVTTAPITAYSSILIGTDKPEPCSILTINSDQKGVLGSRMTSQERLNVPHPVDGLEVYDTDLHAKCIYIVDHWEQLYSKRIKERHKKPKEPSL